MKILLAPDSFKESMSAMEVCEAIEKGFRKVFPEATYVKVPIGDGGEGTVQSFVDMSGGDIIELTVRGPLGGKVDGFYGLSSDKKTAYIEAAAAAGLDLVPVEKRNPFHTSTYGVGELIQDALGKGVEHIILGIGGTATNDGGIGMAAALGARFLDHVNHELEPDVEALKKMKRIDISSIDLRLKNVQFEIACDVSNPLLGENGASYVFGPQKGATIEMVPILDNYLANYALAIEQSLEITVKDVPGAGAGGGLGAAAIVFFGAELKRGIDVMLDFIQFDELLNDVDLVVTGEGKMDCQTIYGKAPIGVSKRAKKQSIPVIAITGALGNGYHEVYQHGIDSVFSIVNGAIMLEEALKNGEKNTENTAESIAKLVKICSEKVF